MFPKAYPIVQYMGENTANFNHRTAAIHFEEKQECRNEDVECAPQFAEMMVELLV